MPVNPTVVEMREMALTPPPELQVERCEMALCSDNPTQNRRGQSVRRLRFSQKRFLLGHVGGENIHTVFARRSLDCKECLRR